jgi:DNA polymerase-3 subunit gamma/tau
MSTGGGAESPAAKVARSWSSDVLPALKPLVRAIYAAAPLVGERDGAVVVGPPNDAHLAKCEQHRPAVEAAITAVAGIAVPLVLVVDPGGASSSANPASGPSGRGPAPADDPYDDIVDPAELTDAPPAAVQSPVERLTQAFPGSELVEGSG